MSSEMVSEYVVSQSRAKAFYERFERKGELQHQTHFCPGCGHGQVHKMLARAIDELGIQESTFLPFVRSAFAQKRKTLANNLRAAGFSPAAAVAAMAQAAIDPQSRAEALSIESLAALWKNLNSAGAQSSASLP